MKAKPVEAGKRPDKIQQGRQAWREVEVLPLGKSRSVEAGHEITVTERGRIIRCSAFCSDLRMKYGAVLGQDPYLDKQMASLEARAKTAAAAKNKSTAKEVAKEAAQFETTLKQADELRTHLFGASEQEWEDALDALTSPPVTGGSKSGHRIGGVKIPKSRKVTVEGKEREVPRRKIGVTDIMTEAELGKLDQGGYREAMDRVNQVMGKKISDIAELKSHWDDIRKRLMGGKTADEIGRDGMLKQYKKAQRAFWKRVRQDPAAVTFLEKHGFELKGKGGAPLAKLGPKGQESTGGKLTRQERRVSLDHIEEKAQGDNWKKSLDGDNLELMFQNANSWKEIVQVKFGMREKADRE
jgi:hypothetical protein